MGDLGTHGEICKHVMGILKEKSPQERWLSKNYMFFELGNFLTDMSQLRDPPAHIAGKIRIMIQGRKDKWHWLLNIANLHNYLNELMGTLIHKKVTHGQLAEFLTQFAFIMGCEQFRRENPPIHPDEFYLIFFNKIGENSGLVEYEGYTQYWPHEHFDFPPWTHRGLFGDRQQSKVDRHLCDGKSGGSKRKILQYLEDQIEYCAELLTVVEFKWRALVEKEDTNWNRWALKKILALYGHVSHTIEDFFFHSNFIDNAWKQLKRVLPEGENTNRYKRIYQRRLRLPKVSEKRKWELSNYDSEMTDLVFTGSFGSEDIFFTVNDALETFWHKSQGEHWVKLSPEPVQEVFLPFFKKEARNMLRNDYKRGKWLKTLRDFVDNVDSHLMPLYDALKQTSFPLHKYSLQAIKKMCEIDNEIYKKYTLIPVESRGPFAFLLEMLIRTDEVVEKSENQSKYLDENPDPPTMKYVEQTLGKKHDAVWSIRASDNGAAGEIIGSHSLINKDNVRKKPLFQQALNAAICVASYIAEVMVGQIRCTHISSARFTNKGDKAVNTVAPPRYVDWLHLLQHFLCHPEECENQWHVEAMEKGKDARTYHVIQFVGEDTVSKRRQQAKRRDLEKLYKDEAIMGEKAYRSIGEISDYDYPIFHPVFP